MPTSPILQRASRARVFVIAILAATVVSSAFADELQDVSKLVAAGRLIEAGNRADAYLEKMPKDAQMRFLKGVILSQRGERDAALGVFTGLTQDYPELPEPYNNIAVIDAAQGRYDDARVALETAIRVAPNNATAYENLGDIYAALAARSYRDARRYDARNATAARKLDAVKGLLTAAAAPTPAAATIATATSLTAAPVAPTPAPSTEPAVAAAPPAPASAPAPAPAARVAPAPVSSAERAQRNVGLPAPAGFPSITSGVLASPPEVVVPVGEPGVAAGADVVGVSTPSAADSPPPTAPLTGARTVIAPVPADATRPIAQITAALQRWASVRSLTIGDPAIRVDGDVAIARFRATDARTGKSEAVDRSLTLHRDGETWFVTEQGF